jgi:ribosomal protein S18 acetylase RimI-like enzyme
MKNAHKFIRENWQPDDMRQEKTPAGRVLTHESGFKFTQDANGKVSAYTSAGAKIGTFNSIKEATVAGKNKFNEVYKNHDAEVKKVFEKKNEEAKRFQALDENERQEAIRNGDLFSLERVKNFIGNRKVLRQSREEFIISKVIEAVENPEILKNAVRKALFSTNKTAFEYRKLLQEFVKVGEEEKRLADEHGVLYERWLRTIDADERSMLSQKMTENSEAAQVLQVQRPKAKFNLERFELEMKKARVDAFVELQNSLSHLTQEQFTEVVKNELMLTYNPELGGKYKAIKKAHSGIAETLFAEAFDDQTQTGVPIVVVGTHGTRNVELMISRILLDEKLGTRYGTAAGGKAYSSDLGHFMGGSTDTSYSYAGLPPSAFTLYAKNGIPINRLAEFLGDGAFLNPYNFPESHPIYSLNKAIFELKKNSQKVNDALLFKAQDAYLELFDKGSSLSYDDLLAKAREVQGILAHLKDIGFIKPNAHKLLIDFTVEAFDKSVRKERPNPISRDEFNYHINNAESLVIDSAFNALDEVRVSIDELLGGGLKNQDKEIKLPEGKSIKVKYDNELYKEVIKLSQETINTLTDTTNGWMGKTNFENKVKMVLGGKKFYEGSSTVDPARTWMQIRGLMAFDNPKVIIDPRGYDESKLAPQMIQAINEGHDGIIFKRLRDGGSEDDIYIQLKGNQNKILTIDTSFDSQHIPRKDENGNVLKTGRDIGLALQPDEVDAPKQVQGIKLDMTKAYDVFRQEYEESTGQSWSQDKFMQRARNWQFFGDENGFVAVRPQRSGFVKLVGMAGDNKSKLRGIQQIQQQGLPIWGMVSKEIKDMAVKRGMREPNMIERTVLKQALNSAALGDAEILGYTSDNGVRLRYPDIGEVVKYMIGSPEYYQKLRSDFGDQIKSKIGFQPDEGEQGGRTYTPEQMAGKFIGRVASENPKLTKYKKIVFTKDTEKGKLGEDTYRLTIKPKDEVASEVKVGYINVEVNGTDATVEYVKVNPRWEGEGYGKLLYSEMVERLRSLGVKEFSGMIIDESGRPQKIRKRIIDQENTRIGEPDDTLIGRTRRDRYGDTQTDVTSYLKEKAWYQPDEKIGTQSSNIKLLLEGMASGRILRTSSYKNLGLEDASLIAHTPDTAKIGQVTAGDKALADLQGGIFYAIANGKKIWASNFAGEGETNILVQFANDQLKSNPNKKTYILLVKPSSGDNSKIFASVDGARGVSNIFKHLNDSKVMTDLRYVDALKNSAEMHLGIKGLEGLGKEELYARIDDALLNSKANKIGFEHRREFTREIARQLDEAGAFDSKRSKKALVKSFHKGFERGFSIVEMERVFGNLMAEDIIKDVPAGHVYGALEIASPLRETPDSGHRGYDASIEQESGDPARLIMFDRTDHVTNIVTKKSGKEIAIHKAGEGSYHSHTGGQIPYQEVKGKSQMPFQPAEFTQFTTEQTAAGRILKNAKGYAIMMVNNKFRVYSPAKVILGVYTDEEQAKNRIYKEIPKR